MYVKRHCCINLCVLLGCFATNICFNLVFLSSEGYDVILFLNTVAMSPVSAKSG